MPKKIKDEEKEGEEPKKRKKTIEQKNYFSGFIYFDFEEACKDHSAARFLKAVQNFWPCPVSVWCVLHDSDYYVDDQKKTDDKGNEVKDAGGCAVYDHRQGDRKKDHIHFVIKSERKKTKQGFIDELAKALEYSNYAPVGKQYNKALITASFCYSFRFAIRYLVHEDENPVSTSGVVLRADKYPYSWEMVATNDLDSLQLAENNISDGDMTMAQFKKGLDTCFSVLDWVNYCGLHTTQRFLGTIKAAMAEKSQFDFAKRNDAVKKEAEAAAKEAESKAKKAS